MRYVCRWSGKNRGIRVRCHGGLLQVFWAGRFLASCYCRARRLDHNCSSDRLATGNHARRSGTWRNAYASLSAVWHRLSLALLGKSGFRQAECVGHSRCKDNVSAYAIVRNTWWFGRLAKLRQVHQIQPRLCRGRERYAEEQCQCE